MTTITTATAAARLGITPRHVRHLIKIGQLPAVKAGRDWLIEEKNLKQAEARKRRGRPRKGETMYSIYAIKPEAGEAEWTINEQTAEDAAATAKDMAARPENTGALVFVSFFRKADGQTGYLNPDGHGPVGKRWTA